MSSKKPSKSVSPKYGFRDCDISTVNNSAANEHTRAAIEALAAAAKANAEAIAAIADGLKGSPITSYGIHASLGGGQ